MPKMPITRNDLLDRLKTVEVPGGGDLVSRDLVRALQVDGGKVRFVIEAADADAARQLEGVRADAERAIAALEGVEAVSVVLTAHGPATAAPKPPSRNTAVNPNSGSTAATRS